MKKYFNIVAIALAMVLGTYAVTKGEDAPAAKPLHGKVTAVAKDTADATLTDITISVGKKGETPTEKVIKVGDKVTVTKGKDKEAATLADVVVGANIYITMDADKKVTAISIHTAKKPA